MTNIGEHLKQHQKINLDKEIRKIAKEEAQKIPTGGGGGGGGGTRNYNDLINKPDLEAYLKLDQTISQEIVNGMPIFTKGLVIKAGERIYFDG